MTPTRPSYMQPTGRLRSDRHGEIVRLDSTTARSDAHDGGQATDQKLWQESLRAAPSSWERDDADKSLEAEEACFAGSQVIEDFVRRTAPHESIDSPHTAPRSVRTVDASSSMEERTGAAPPTERGPTEEVLLLRTSSSARTRMVDPPTREDRGRGGLVDQQHLLMVESCDDDLRYNIFPPGTRRKRTELYDRHMHSRQIVHVGGTEGQLGGERVLVRKHLRERSLVGNKHEDPSTHAAELAEKVRELETTHPGGGRSGVSSFFSSHCPVGVVRHGTIRGNRSIQQFPLPCMRMGSVVFSCGLSRADHFCTRGGTAYYATLASVVEPTSVVSRGNQAGWTTSRH